jgi:hypothetical protein
MIIILQATHLDEAAGIRKNPENETPEAKKVVRPLSGTWNQSPSSISTSHNLVGTSLWLVTLKN